MGTPGRRGATQNFYFIHNSVNKRKMALGYKSQSRFVYSLGQAQLMRLALSYLRCWRMAFITSSTKVYSFSDNPSMDSFSCIPYA